MDNRPAKIRNAARALILRDRAILLQVSLIERHLALFAGVALSYAATAPAIPAGFSDRRPQPTLGRQPEAPQTGGLTDGTKVLQYGRSR